jgi:hypothetical protein
MRSVISVVSVLACAFLSDAQITATLKASPEGSNEIIIKNNGVVSVTAFAIAAHRKADDQTLRALPAHSLDLPSRFYFDSTMDLAVTPLLPNEERTVAQSSVLLSRSDAQKHFIIFEEPIIIGGIFTDGATTGDAVLIWGLMLRRSNMLLAVEATLDTLSHAGAHNIPRDQLIEQFMKMAEFVNHWYIPPEEQISRALYLSMMEKLRHVPEGPLGSPFPPSAFVEQETAVLRQQRARLVESRPGLDNALLNWK